MDPANKKQKENFEREVYLIMVFIFLAIVGQAFV
jgi:hypothetical protein